MFLQFFPLTSAYGIAGTNDLLRKFRSEPASVCNRLSRQPAFAAHGNLCRLFPHSESNGLRKKKRKKIILEHKKSCWDNNSFCRNWAQSANQRNVCALEENRLQRGPRLARASFHRSRFRLSSTADQRKRFRLSDRAAGRRQRLHDLRCSAIRSASSQPALMTTTTPEFLGHTAEAAA